MARIQIVKISMNVTVTVPSPILEERTGHCPLDMGARLAQQVHDHSEREALGYFPPLAYCNEHGVVDSDLLAQHQRVAGYACQFSSTEIRLRLTPVFSHLRVEQVQSTAYTMPQIRIGQEEALECLARHFSPAQVRMELVASSLQRGVVEGIERLSGQKVRRWLEGRFDAVDVTGAHILEQ